MNEIRELHAALKPVETLFVVDAMQGQDAVNTAKAFKEALPLTGIVLTKLDGDSRGGAALSVRQVTGAPIKFAGSQREDRRPRGVRRRAHAGRILGMGDIVALVEEVQQGRRRGGGAEARGQGQVAARASTSNDFAQQLAQMKQDGRPRRPDRQAAGAAGGQGRPAPTWTAPSATCAAWKASSTR